MKDQEDCDVPLLPECEYDPNEWPALTVLCFIEKYGTYARQWADCRDSGATCELRQSCNEAAHAAYKLAFELCKVASN